MAIVMDFLKKAVKTITETKANIEKEIKEVQEKPYREEAEKLILAPDCEHGDCVVMPDLSIGFGASCFYTTCNKEQCPKYCENKKDIYTAVDARMIRFFSQYQKWYEAPEIYKEHVMYPLGEMVKEVFPHLASARDAIIRICNYWRLDENNYLLKLVRELHDCGAEFTQEDDIQRKLDYLCDLVRGEDMSIFDFYPTEKIRSFFYNPSLYKRAFVDFKYTVYICSIVADDRKLNKYFTDIAEINYKEFLDEGGNVKPAECLEDIADEWTRLYGKDDDEE